MEDNSVITKCKGWYKDIYGSVYDPRGFTLFFQIIMAFTVGLIFASFSYGFLWFLIYYIVFEIYLVWRLYKVPSTKYMISRFGIFCSGLLGFIIGRYFENDHEPIRDYY